MAQYTANSDNLQQKKDAGIRLSSLAVTIAQSSSNVAAVRIPFEAPPAARSGMTAANTAREPTQRFRHFMYVITKDRIERTLDDGAVKPSEGSMTKERLEHFRKLLEKELTDIIQKASSTEGQSELLEYFSTPDWMDAADLEQSREAALLKEATEYQRWMDVQAALRKIKNGTYGICESCGGEISEARLEAYPTAKLCLDCQRDHEVRTGGGPEVGTRLNRFVEYTKDVDLDWEE